MGKTRSANNIKGVEGDISGLKPSQKKRLSALVRRKINRHTIAPAPFVRSLAELSFEIERQIGAIIDRSGQIRRILVGDAKRIFIPDLGRIRTREGRFRGLRLIHTHLDNSPLSQEDLHDLSLSRLDLIASVGITPSGQVGNIYYAHLLPENPKGELWRVEGPLTPHQLESADFLELVSSWEDEFSKSVTDGRDVSDGTRAILIGVYNHRQKDWEARIEELENLAKSAGLTILDKAIQLRDRPDPRYLIGSGKFEELLIRAVQLGAEILVFDAELSPVQLRNIAEQTELKILDRTQLILDIFAQRAHSRDGKIQVELAQLKYLLPRLQQRDDAMSRLTGGIGGRGPGETKLEIDRRRVKDRIHRLEKQLKSIRQHRKNRRKFRQKRRVPIISIIGYTNAGKSTLLNSLTQSSVLSEDKMFSTLDPVSRRLVLPSGREVVITDTVGFIRDLPPDLVAAFQATLEELEDATLLVHLIDASDPAFHEQIEAVEKILVQLSLQEKEVIRVFNKIDRVDPQELEFMLRRYDAIPLSALNPETFGPFLEALEQALQKVEFRRETEYNGGVTPT